MRGGKGLVYTGVYDANREGFAHLAPREGAAYWALRNVLPK